MTPSLEAKQLETHVAAALPGDGDHPRCVACGYDVRGLPPRAKCPECGLDVAMSLAARRAPAPPVDPRWRDPRWRRQVMEAAGMSALAFLFQFGAAFWPRALDRDTGPKWLVAGELWTVAGLAVAAWALLWLAAMKLGAAARLERPGRRVALAVALCILATVYAALPVWAYFLRQGFTPGLSRVAAIVRAYTPSLAAAAFFLQLGVAFARLGAPGPAAQARLVAFLMPFALFDFTLDAGAGPSPVQDMIQFPNYQHGHPGAAARAVSLLLRGEIAEVFWSSLRLAVPAAATYLVVRLLVVARRARPAWQAGTAGRLEVDPACHHAPAEGRAG